ncbi:MAG: DUF169 domain-containing protein [Dissulfuribacterales bacterium]
MTFTIDFTFPTYIKKEKDIPEQAIRPSGMGQKWSLCQAFTYARRHGWHVAMTADDNFCVPASVFHKWVDVSDEDLIESQVQQGWHKDRAAEQNRFNFFKGLFAGPEGEKTLKKMIRQHLKKRDLLVESGQTYITDVDFCIECMRACPVGERWKNIRPKELPTQKSGVMGQA